MKDWMIVIVSVTILILVATEVVKISQLPVMEVDVETQSCYGMRFAPDYELVSCKERPADGKYDVIFVNRKTCE